MIYNGRTLYQFQVLSFMAKMTYENVSAVRFEFLSIQLGTCDLC